MSYGVAIPVNPQWYASVQGQPAPTTYAPVEPVKVADFAAAADEAVSLYKEHVSFAEGVKERVHAQLDAAVAEVKALVASGAFGTGPFTATISGHAHSDNPSDSPDWVQVQVTSVPEPKPAATA